MGSAGWFTYERRFVEWAEGEGFEFDYAVSSDLDADPDLVEGYDLVLGVGHDEYWSAGPAGGDRGARPWRRQLRQPVGQHHVLAGPPGGRRASNGVPQVPRPRDRPGRRHRGPADDDGHVGRSVGRPAGDGAARRQLGVRVVQPVRCGDAARLGRDSPSTATTTGCSPAPGCVTATCSAQMTEWSATRPSGCRLAFDDYQLPVAVGGDGDTAHVEVVAFTPSSNLAMGEYPKSICGARRSRRSRVHRVAAVRPRRCRCAGAAAAMAMR